MGFFWEERGMRKSKADFVAVRMVMVICFGTAPFSLSPSFMLGNSQSSCSSWPVTEVTGPQFLLWHGWLPGLSSAGERDPWAASLGRLAHMCLERALGSYPADDSGLWTPLDLGDAEDLVNEIGEH